MDHHHHHLEQSRALCVFGLCLVSVVRVLDLDVEHGDGVLVGAV